MYKVTKFEKRLKIETSQPYGSIKVFFAGNGKKTFNSISITKFMALSHILENDIVGYDPDKKIFLTPPEPANFVQSPEGEIV